MSAAESAQQRANYLPITRYHDLNIACQILAEAFDWNVYLVGSCMTRPDYRDVDVRCILDDEVFDREFPGHVAAEKAALNDVKLLAMNLAFSAYLSKQSQLDVDFQFQRRTQANEKFRGVRSALGISLTLWLKTESSGAGNG